MARRRTTKSKASKEQLELLKLILEELRATNSQLAAMANRPLQGAAASHSPQEDSAEELDSYE